MAPEEIKKPVSNCPRRRAALGPGPVPEGATPVAELTEDDKKRLSAGKTKEGWPDLPDKEAGNFMDAEPVLILNWDPKDNPERFKRLEGEYPELKKGGYTVAVRKELSRVTTMEGGRVKGDYWLADDSDESGITSEAEFRSRYAVKEGWNDSDRLVKGEVRGSEDQVIRPGVSRKRDSVIRCWKGKAAFQPVEGHKETVWKGGGEQLYIPNTVKTGKGLYTGDTGVKRPPWESEAAKKKKAAEQADREKHFGIKRDAQGNVIKKEPR